MPTTEKASKSATQVSTQQRLDASAKNAATSSAKDLHGIDVEGHRPSVLAEGAKAWEGAQSRAPSEPVRLGKAGFFPGETLKLWLVS